jgi:hypothetical protein
MPVDSIAVQLKELGRERLWIELGLGAVTPGLLAAMMMTFVVAPDLYVIFMIAAVLSAISVIWPVMRLNRKSYDGWQPNTLPKSLVVAALGLIYITEVGIFSVVMLSVYKGLSPDSPVTFAVAGSLVLGLIAITAYNDKNKGRFDRTHRHMVNGGEETVKVRVKGVLDKKGHQYSLSQKGNTTRIDLTTHGVMIDLRPVSTGSTEVLMEVAESGNHAFAQDLRADIHFD